MPFAFIEEGGFAGIRRALWGGVAGDIVAIFSVALLADRFPTRPSSRRLVFAVKQRVQRVVAVDSDLPIRQAGIGLGIIALAYLIAWVTKQ